MTESGSSAAFEVGGGCQLAADIGHGELAEVALGAIAEKGHHAAAGGQAAGQLALAAPVFSLALGADPRLSGLILVCALVGGLAFAFVGGVGAALSLGARRGGLLTAVIVLPLFVPPVIFGGGALEAFGAGLPWRPGFALMCAYAAGAVALGPVAMAAACRNALS